MSGEVEGCGVCAELIARLEVLADEWSQGQHIPHGGPAYARDLRAALEDEN